MGGVANNAEFVIGIHDIVDGAQGVRFLIEDINGFVLGELLRELFKRARDIARARHRDGEFLLAALAVAEDVLDLVDLCEDIARVLHEALAVRRETHPLGRALEKDDAERELQFLDGAADIRLRHIQRFRRPVDGAGARDFDRVLQVLQIHVLSPFFDCFHVPDMILAHFCPGYNAQFFQVSRKSGNRLGCFFPRGAKVGGDTRKKH